MKRCVLKFSELILGSDWGRFGFCCLKSDLESEFFIVKKRKYRLITKAIFCSGLEVEP